MRFSFTVILLQIFLVSTVFGQEVGPEISIKKSTDKVKIEGKYYYIHIVHKGETLYSISKAYNVSQIEIAMENPDIYFGIQVDQALKIPIKDSKDNIPQGNEDDDFIYHVVRKGETLYSLSRKYQLPMETIIKINPEIETGIKLSQVVLIPKERIETLGSESPDKSERFIYHEVQPREGFYSISKKYKVSEETIRRFNADLVKDGLKLGTVLRIPNNPVDTIPTADYKNVVLKDSAIDSVAKTQKQTVVCDTFIYNKNNTFNVVIMLPFYVYEFENPPVDSVALEQSILKGIKYEPTVKVPAKSTNFIDFYQGVLLAIDSLKHEGLSVKLSVFDTGKNVETVKQLLKDKSLLDANLIIGPVFPECLKPVADFARENRIPVVSPLSPNNYLLNENPYLFQINPSFITQLQEFSKSIDVCSGYNMVMIHEADSTANTMVDSYKNYLKQKIGTCRDSAFIHIKELTYKPGSSSPEITEIISHSLILDKENMIFVPSNNEAFVIDLLGNLHTLATYYTYPITVYGMPRWQKFRNVQVEYYYRLQLHLFTPFFVDYSNSLVKDFITNYRDQYRLEPSQYAFQGYDVAYYFLSALMKYGNDFQFCLQHHSVKLLQSEYNFQQINDVSGYENRSVYMIRYNKNFDLQKVETDSQIKNAALKYLDESQSKPQAVIFK